MCVYSFFFYLHLLTAFKTALGWLLLSIFSCLPAFLPFLMFYLCFFMVLEHLHFYLVFFHVLASCSSILWVLFLVFIFVHFYLVKCTFLQSIVNYDVWHTFWSLHVAGWALEFCFDVLPVFFHGFRTPTFLPRVFSCFGLLFLHTLGFVFGLHFCALLPRKIHLFTKHRKLRCMAYSLCARGPH